MKANLRRFLRHPQILVILAPLLLLSPVYLTGRALFWGTPITQFVPWWLQALKSLQNGQLPLWNPLAGMGAPLLANYQSGLLYPPNWAFLLLGGLGGAAAIAWGQGLMVALHLAWAGWGMVRLARRLGWGPLPQTVCGLSFGLSGYLVARGHFLSMTFTLAWLPWIMEAALAAVRQPASVRKWLRFSLLMALQLLAGHAQLAWYTFLLAVAWVVFWGWERGGWVSLRGALLRFVPAVALSAILAAPQLLPTAEYLLNSARSAQVDFSFAATYSFWPWRFLTLLAPNLFGSPASGDYWGYGAYWEDAVYLGLLAVFLVLLAVLRWRKTVAQRRVARFLVLVAALAFLLALGDNAPVFPWLYQHVPSFDMFQAPARFTIWAVFALALLAGQGAAIWRRPRARGLYWARLGLAAAASVVLGAVLAGRLISDVQATFVTALALAGFWAVGIGVLDLTAPSHVERRSPALWGWAVALWLAADLLVAGWGLNPGASLDLYHDEASTAAELRAQLDGERLYLSSDDEYALKFERFFTFDSFTIDEPWENLRAAMLPNTFILDQIPSADNFDPLLPERYDRWMEALESAPESVREGILSRMAVGAVEALDPDAPLGVRFEAFEGGARLRWVPCAQWVDDGEAALDAVLSGEVDPAETVILEGEGPGSADCISTPAALIELVQDTPNRLVVHVEAEQSGWLVLADLWYPGWQAYLDGSEVTIWRADYLFRAVSLEAGAHELVFIYRPWAFYAGVLIAIVGFGIVVWLWKRVDE